MSLRDIIHPYRSDTLFCNLASNHLGHFFSMSVHRCVSYHNSILAHVVAPTIVHIQHFSYMCTKHRTMGSSYNLYIKCGKLFQSLTYRASIFTNYIGIIPRSEERRVGKEGRSWWLRGC